MRSSRNSMGGLRIDQLIEEGRRHLRAARVVDAGKDKSTQVSTPFVGGIVFDSAAQSFRQRRPPARG
jgi:hypothetical protein